MNEFKKITLVCDDSFDGIMTAVYDGWVLMLKGNKVKIYPGDDYAYELFCENINCKTNVKKAISVAQAIQQKISVEAYEYVFRAAHHYDKNRGNTILEFLKVGFRAGSRTTKMLSENRVMTVMELARKASNEANVFREILRFKEINGKFLFGTISPKCDVLLLIENHFTCRYPEENWIIYDDIRKKALVHRYKSETIVVSGEELDRVIDQIDIDDDYEELWKVFFDAIAIEERRNEKCQMSHIPKWYRKHMNEFN